MKLIKILILTAAFAFAAALTACSTSDHAVNDRIAEAEAALNAGDFVKAQSLSETVSGDLSSLTVRQLCRLSLLYIKIGENTENEDDIDLAARCYREAFELDTDSAVLIYAECPVQDITYVMTLTALVRDAESVDSFPDEMPDSLFTDSIHAL
ncbi:MAG: hypothetical protein NC098_03170 [Lachnoclostridium sp.]|nr:hypothetical protein [Lachnoclostridium sp.]